MLKLSLDRTSFYMDNNCALFSCSILSKESKQKENYVIVNRNKKEFDFSNRSETFFALL